MLKGSKLHPSGYFPGFSLITNVPYASQAISIKYNDLSPLKNIHDIDPSGIEIQVDKAAVDIRQIMYGICEAFTDGYLLLPEFVPYGSELTKSQYLQASKTIELLPGTNPMTASVKKTYTLTFTIDLPINDTVSLGTYAPYGQYIGESGYQIAMG